MARTRTANISGELITNTLIVTSTGANVSNAVVKTGDTMTGELNVANSLIVTGNVGIGTSLPGSKIQIDGNSDVSDEDCMLRIVDRDTTSGSQIPTIQFLGGSSANQIGMLRVNDTNGFTFRNNANSTVVIFKQDGNVGIGKSDPSFELDVVGRIYSNNLVQSSTAVIGDIPYLGNTFSGMGSNASNRGIWFARDLSNTYPDLVITSDGNVGIGTPSPADKLHVVGNLRLAGGDTYILGDGGDLYIDTENVSGRDLLLQTQSGQNVGIGTTSPAFKLDVNGSGRFRGGSLYLGLPDTASGHINSYELMTFNIDVDNDDADTRYFAWFKNGADASGTQLMILNENGYLGLGSITPTSKLLIVNPNTTTASYGVAANSAVNITIPNVVGTIGQIIFTNESSPNFGYGAIGMVMTSGVGVGLGDIFFATKSVGTDAVSTERMRITSSGSVLVGATNSDIGGSVAGINLRSTGKIQASTDTNLGIFFDEPLYLDRRNISGDGVAIVLARHGYYKAGIGVVAGASASSEGIMTFYTGSNSGFNERARFTSDGHFLINQTNPTDYNSSVGHSFYPDGRWFGAFSYNSSGAEIILLSNEISGGTAACLQYRTNWSSTVEGTLEGTSSGLAIVNVSDYRKKTNVQTLSGCLNRISQLRPVSYNLKPEYTQTPEKIVTGLIAHEVQEVMPDLVDGEKDAVYTQEDIDSGMNGIVGAPKLQAVRYTSNEMIVNLIGAIQDLKAELDQAKNRITELENK